jgi:hypothetical protein
MYIFRQSFLVQKGWFLTSMGTVILMDLLNSTFAYVNMVRCKIIIVSGVWYNIC